MRNAQWERGGFCCPARGAGEPPGSAGTPAALPHSHRRPRDSPTLALQRVFRHFPDQASDLTGSFGSSLRICGAVGARQSAGPVPGPWPAVAGWRALRHGTTARRVWHRGHLALGPWLDPLSFGCASPSIRQARSIARSLLTLQKKSPKFSGCQPIDFRYCVCVFGQLTYSRNSISKFKI